MIYYSIDIETSGLDHNTCQIIEFAIVADDLNVQAPIESLPFYHTYIIQKNNIYSGEPYALSIHSEIFKKLNNWKKEKANFCYPENLFSNIYTFLTTLCGCKPNDGIIEINVTGKNFGYFDSRFLEKLNMYDKLVKFNHRILDPAILYFDPKIDKSIPNTKLCMERANIYEDVKHTALEDAINIIKLVRYKYPKTH